ncbi:hypothetical protein HIM_07598 [Hirsutella minnesotensis 3608]|uniref:Uncharacterized protein n=1 Tax=Hirsutella minnesotensis 3608 TaxID=1043627 RepID=A0A0F7ZHQ0_9HYPO|nr:hypothetical protein HIM_07598 [Hirsutella minnesotensis 3608]
MKYWLLVLAVALSQLACVNAGLTRRKLPLKAILGPLTDFGRYSSRKNSGAQAVNGLWQKYTMQKGDGSAADDEDGPVVMPAWELNAGSNEERGKRLARVWFSLERKRQPNQNRVETGQTRLLHESTWNPCEGRWCDFIYPALNRELQDISKFANLVEEPESIDDQRRPARNYATTNGTLTTATHG